MPEVLRFRESMYQNWLSVNDVSSSKQMSGICELSQDRLSSSCCMCENSTFAPLGKYHADLPYGFPLASGYSSPAVSHNPPCFTIWVCVRRNTTAPNFGFLM